mmetsp:Transcript_33339/g.107888  ORF Transcript_33339/g.107888 Transcript_33339/m.107888 type:complete len:337 (-) Transcript_33339:4-1014(-)|eukprot:scaffold26921_cov105-Isochrysis_galbana.AAC.2
MLALVRSAMCTAAACSLRDHDAPDMAARLRPHPANGHHHCPLRDCRGGGRAPSSRLYAGSFSMTSPAPLLLSQSAAGTEKKSDEPAGLFGGGAHEPSRLSRSPANASVGPGMQKWRQSTSAVRRREPWAIAASGLSAESAPTRKVELPTAVARALSCQFMCELISQPSAWTVRLRLAYAATSSSWSTGEEYFWQFGTGCVESTTTSEDGAKPRSARPCAMERSEWFTARAKVAYPTGDKCRRRRITVDTQWGPVDTTTTSARAARVKKGWEKEEASHWASWRSSSLLGAYSSRSLRTKFSRTVSEHADAVSSVRTCRIWTLRPSCPPSSITSDRKS